MTVGLTWFSKIQHDSEFLKNREAIKNPLGKCFYPEGASHGRIYNWLTNPDGGGGAPLLALSCPPYRLTNDRSFQLFVIYPLLQDKNIVLHFKVSSF